MFSSLAFSLSLVHFPTFVSYILFSFFISYLSFSSALTNLSYVLFALPPPPPAFSFSLVHFPTFLSYISFSFFKSDLSFSSALSSLSYYERGKDRDSIKSSTASTQDTNGKVTTSQLDITNESQEVSPFPAGDHKA